jgi:hypothetical protein
MIPQIPPGVPDEQGIEGVVQVFKAEAVGQDVSV